MKTYLFECIVAHAHPLWKQNGILIFVKEKKFLCFEFESQNWQYELINCQSHNVHLRYGISLCMPFLHENSLYCAYAAQRSCDNTEQCRPMLGRESIFSVNIYCMFQINIVHEYPDIWSAVNLGCVKILGFPFLK